MLCLLGNTSQLCPLSSVSCLIHFSFDPCLIYFLSHIFRVSFILCSISFASHFVRCLICFMSRLRSCLNSQAAQAAQAAQAVSQHSDCVSNHVLIQATSRNQLYVTRTEIGDSWRNKIYIERADILYSVGSSDQSLMRLVIFNPFIDEIFALPFDSLICSASLRLICSVSHIFRVSRFRPFSSSQIMSRHQATSRNQSCLTRVREWGSCSRRMYIERAAHPVFSIMLLIRSDTQFNLFIDEIFAWPFDRL